MSHYLGFSPVGRLIATREVALHPGAVPPDAVFGVEGVVAVEIRPEVIVKVRPPVWSALVGHASRSAAGVQVDSLQTIQDALRAAELARLERDLVSAAEACALRESAGRMLSGGLPPAAREDAAKMQQRLRQLDVVVARARGGSFPAPVKVPNLLQDLAGRELPL